MIKLCGLLLLFLSCVLVGVSSAAKLRERVKLLTSLELLVQRLRSELSLRLPTLVQLFSDDRDEKTLPLTSLISQHLAEGETPQQSAAAAFSSQYAKRLLKTSEREYLCTVVSSLGSADVIHADKLLENAQAQLAAYAAEAVEYERTHSRTRLILSIYIGLAAVILLM